MSTSVSINSSFTFMRQSYAYGNRAVEGSMIRWLIGILWKDRDAALHKQHQREQDAARERQNRERNAEERVRREKDDAGFLNFLLTTDACRRAYEDLSRDIDDAIMATRLAYKRAVVKEELVREALEVVQRHAIVLPDGRRVYFSRDGRLYSDDRQEITDTISLAEARALRQDKPDAPTFEIYTEIYTKHEIADARVQQLSALLTRLDELKESHRSGKITPEDTQHRREELARVLDALPLDVRSDYDSIRSPRKESYTTALTAPVLHEQLAQAEDAFTKQDAQVRPDTGTTSQPAYKHIPDF